MSVVETIRIPSRLPGRCLTPTLVTLLLIGCSRRPPATESETIAPATQEAHAAAWSGPEPEGPPATRPPAAEKSDESPTQIEPRRLPEDLQIGQSVELPVSGDRSLRVAHADASRDQALVYLHGMCGNPLGAEPWMDLAVERGTLIVVRANVPCPDRPGYKWPKEVEPIQERIDAALALVKEKRGGLLNTETVTLIGYSQGAHRAEKLAAAYPGRYPMLVLGGPPTPPEPESFSSRPRIAILGGELENTDHMHEGHRNLLDSGLAARFFLLPRAHHGGYGPQGPRVMKEVFDWLDQSP